MGKDTSPKCKKCRREGEKLFLKGERCNTPKCAMVKRNYPPGVHGQTGNGGRGSHSEYLMQLREKQKAKRTYGLLEKQFHNYYLKASRAKGTTGSNLLKSLESRLDSIIYRVGIADSRSQARQLVSHNHFMVNGKKVNIPSYNVKPSEEITIKPSSKDINYFIACFKSLNKDNIPTWVDFDLDAKKIKVTGEPSIQEMEEKIDTKLIIEFYSRQ